MTGIPIVIPAPSDQTDGWVFVGGMFHQVREFGAEFLDSKTELGKELVKALGGSSDVASARILSDLIGLADVRSAACDDELGLATKLSQRQTGRRAAELTKGDRADIGRAAAKMVRTTPVREVMLHQGLVHFLGKPVDVSIVERFNKEVSTNPREEAKLVLGLLSRGMNDARLAIWCRPNGLAQAIYCPDFNTALVVRSLMLGRELSMIGICPCCDASFFKRNATQRYIYGHGARYRKRKQRGKT